MAYVVMAYIFLAYIVMAYIVMAYVINGLYRYGLYSCGLYSYGLYIVMGLYSYGPIIFLAYNGFGRSWPGRRSGRQNNNSFNNNNSFGLQRFWQVVAKQKQWTTDKVKEVFSGIDFDNTGQIEYIVMAYIVMTYIVMAYIVMANIVMACTVMASNGSCETIWPVRAGMEEGAAWMHMLIRVGRRPAHLVLR